MIGSAVTVRSCRGGRVDPGAWCDDYRCPGRALAPDRMAWRKAPYRPRRCCRSRSLAAARRRSVVRAHAAAQLADRTIAVRRGPSDGKVGHGARQAAAHRAAAVAGVLHGAPPHVRAERGASRGCRHAWQRAAPPAARRWRWHTADSRRAGSGSMARMASGSPVSAAQRRRPSQSLITDVASVVEAGYRAY